MLQAFNLSIFRDIPPHDNKELNIRYTENLSLLQIHILYICNYIQKPKTLKTISLFIGYGGDSKLSVPNHSLVNWPTESGFFTPSNTMSHYFMLKDKFQALEHQLKRLEQVRVRLSHVWCDGGGSTKARSAIRYTYDGRPGNEDPAPASAGPPG